MTNDYLLKAFSPAKLGSLPLKNRIIKAATYEGKTPDGIPGQALLDFHQAVAEGGVAMTTISYCTVEADARINDQMMWLHEGIRGQLTDLTQTLKRTAPGIKISGQLTHSGGFTKNRKLMRLQRPVGPSKTFNMLGATAGIPFIDAMDSREIDLMVALYADAASFMQSVGFDAAEIHFGHGYGLSQFISPKTNKRTDEYGGNLGNRMRLPLRVLEAIKAAVGDDFPVIGKINLTDGIKDGLHLAEAIKVATLLDKGGLDALVCSGGTSPYNPMVYFRGESLGTGLAEQQKNPLARFFLKIASNRLFKTYPYYENYFLEDAKKVRDSVSCQMIYIGGCTELESLEEVMREGFDFVQMARPLIKDPAYVNNAIASLDSGKTYVNGCIHCNRCASLIEAPGGVYCPLNKERAQCN